MRRCVSASPAAQFTQEHERRSDLLLAAVRRTWDYWVEAVSREETREHESRLSQARRVYDLIRAARQVEQASRDWWQQALLLEQGWQELVPPSFGMYAMLFDHYEAALTRITKAVAVWKQAEDEGLSLVGEDARFSVAFECRQLRIALSRQALAIMRRLQRVDRLMLSANRHTDLLAAAQKAGQR